jgi:branched-chain amino acid transport system ATP-binding protein
MTDALLDVEDLNAHYGASHVLRGVGFRLGHGETLALMGRNGMGKTTTIRSIVGLTPPSGGTVRLRGRVITGEKPHITARRGVGLVPEGRGIFASLSVRENLVMAERPGVDGDAAWTLESVCRLFPVLGERLGGMGDELSGGEQQMLAIGRALMTNPSLLFLDEATEGLAPKVRETIWSVIETVRRAGLAVVVVDKDVDRLLSVADSAVILEKGVVAWRGAAADLAADPDTHRRYLGV